MPSSRHTEPPVQSDLFGAPISAAYRSDGQPSRPSRCPSPNPTPAFGSTPARRLLSFPIPKLAVTNFREFAHRPLPARTPRRTRRLPSRPRRAGRARPAARPFVLVASSLALLGGRSLHTDPLERALGTPALAHPRLTQTCAVLPPARRVRSADDLPCAGLVGAPVVNLELQSAGPCWRRARSARASWGARYRDAI